MFIRLLIHFIENLDAGQDFSKLPDTYVIFITECNHYNWKTF